MQLCEDKCDRGDSTGARERCDARGVARRALRRVIVQLGRLLSVRGGGAVCHYYSSAPLLYYRRPIPSTSEAGVGVRVEGCEGMGVCGVPLL